MSLVAPSSGNTQDWYLWKTLKVDKIFWGSNYGYKCIPFNGSVLCNLCSSISCLLSDTVSLLITTCMTWIENILRFELFKLAENGKMLRHFCGSHTSHCHLRHIGPHQYTFRGAELFQSFPFHLQIHRLRLSKASRLSLHMHRLVWLCFIATSETGPWSHRLHCWPYIVSSMKQCYTAL